MRVRNVRKAGLSVPDIATKREDCWPRSFEPSTLIWNVVVTEPEVEKEGWWRGMGRWGDREIRTINPLIQSQRALYAALSCWSPQGKPVSWELDDDAAAEPL